MARQKPDTSTREWVGQPEMSNDAVRQATGRGWDEWCDLIDAWAGNDVGHTAIAEFLVDEHEVDGWWAQTVTVGYERITGVRRPHQRADGTFTANKSGTVAVDADSLRQMLLEADDRADVFPGLETELRSRPTSKAIRVAIGPGVATIAIDPRPDGRTRIVIQHDGLASAAEVALWKEHWTAWLTAIDGT